MQRNIIVVEDERDLADLVALHLRREGFRVDTYGDGAQGFAAIDRDTPDLVVLDLMLPGMDGLEICRRIRQSGRLERTLVLVLTARGEEIDVVGGLETGADDYMTKPFSPRELVARVRSLLRRVERGNQESELVRAGALEVDSGRHEVRLGQEQIKLTHNEFKILRFLALAPGRVRSRDDILKAIGETSVLVRTVDVHVASLRRKLGDGGVLVETVRGVGYRLSDTTTGD